MLYALLGGLGALGILALLVLGHLTIQSVVGIAIALSNAFGLIAGATTASDPARVWHACWEIRGGCAAVT